MASGKDSRTKVVLARKLEKQGLGTTPELIERYKQRRKIIFHSKVVSYYEYGKGRIIK